MNDLDEHMLALIDVPKLITRDDMALVDVMAA
jgi:hypothetical protein